MEEDRQLSKFICKLCDKKYPCGKSLGGHMRSHVIANSAEMEEKIEPNMKKFSSMVKNGGGGSFYKKDSRLEDQFDAQNGVYGLRENPKKTWRAVDSDFPLPQEKICKQCGKVFQSLKALCGHMACHSEKEKGVKDDHSWTSESQKLVMDSHSDTEVEDRKLRSKSKNKRYKRIVIKSSSISLVNNNDSSSISEIDEQEQEEMALCLMMLSKDMGNKGGVNSFVESSDNNSVVLETKSSSIDMRFGKKEGVNCVENRDESLEKKKLGVKKLISSVLDAEIVQEEDSDSGYFLAEATKEDSDVSVHKIRRNASFWDCQRPKKPEHSVAEMKKSYKSEWRKNLAKESGFRDGGITMNSMKYESKKRTIDCFDDTELVADSYKRMKYGSSNAEVSNNAHKRSRYECLNCKKVFKSYQALGGHRPCHKRINACSQSRYETGENSSDADNVSFGNKKPIAKETPRKSEKKIKSKKHKGHVCPFCNRVFKSGQALGGHKRSHFLGGNEGHSHQSSMIKPEAHDLFDLNLPAPLEDEDDGHAHIASW